MVVQDVGAGAPLQRVRFSRETVPDQLLAAALLGTAAIQAGIVLNPHIHWNAPMIVPEAAGLALRVVAGTWLLATAGRPRRPRTWLAIALADIALLVWSFAVIGVTQLGILILVLGRLPFVCAVLRGRQLSMATAALLLGPAAVLVHRVQFMGWWELSTVWLYLVAALVIGGSTLRVTRALTASETRAQELSAKAQASEVQAQASAAQARASEERALASAAQAQELAARREHPGARDSLRS